MYVYFAVVKKGVFILRRMQVETLMVNGAQMHLDSFSTALLWLYLITAAG